MENLSIQMEERETERKLINMVLQFPKEEKEVLMLCANALRVRDSIDKKKQA